VIWATRHQPFEEPPTAFAPHGTVAGLRPLGQPGDTILVGPDVPSDELDRAPGRLNIQGELTLWVPRTVTRRLISAFTPARPTSQSPSIARPA
jgi:hypothetical protein